MDLHDINQIVHLCAGFGKWFQSTSSPQQSWRQLCGLRIRIKTIESIWKHYQGFPMGIGLCAGEINGPPEFNSSFILLLDGGTLFVCQ